MRTDSTAQHTHTAVTVLDIVALAVMEAVAVEVTERVRDCVDVCVGVREVLAVHDGVKERDGVTVPVIVGSSSLSQHA